MGLPARIFWWLARRLLLALFLAGAVLAGLGWLGYRRDGGDFLSHRQAVIRGLIVEMSRLRDSLAANGSRAGAVRIEYQAQKERADQARKVSRQLTEFSTGVNRLTTDSAQLDENKERLVRMQQMESDALGHATDLEHELVRVQWERDGIEASLARKQQELTAARKQSSPWWHYAVATWTTFGRWVLAGSGVVVFVLPVLFRKKKARG